MLPMMQASYYETRSPRGPTIELTHPRPMTLESPTTEADELQAPTRVASGELLASPVKPYYDEEGITIYHGDSRQIVPLLPRMSLLLTDPPYGIGIAANPVRQKHAKKNWDAQPPDKSVLEMMLSKTDKAIVWGGNYFGMPPTQCFLIWDKIQPENFSLAMCEQAWTNLKMPAKMFRKSVLSYTKLHPTQKPDELLTWCITMAGEDVKTILDPYAGSGTTGRAAKALGKRCVLIEQEEAFCEIAALSLCQRELGLANID